MRKQLFPLFVVISLLVVTGTAMASDLGTGKSIVVKVGFEFMVGDKTMPAGSYRITPTGTDAMQVRIEPAAGGPGAVATVITRLAQRGKSSSGPNASLVFDKVGNSNILSEIWTPGQDGFLVSASAAREQHTVIPAKE